MFITLAVVKLSKVDNVRGERDFWAHSFGGSLQVVTICWDRTSWLEECVTHSRGEARILKEGARDSAPLQGPAPPPTGSTMPFKEHHLLVTGHITHKTVGEPYRFGP